MQERMILRYSDAFKRAVISDLEKGRFASVAQQKSAEAHECQDLAGECASSESSESKTQTDKGGQTPVLAGRTGKWRKHCCQQKSLRFATIAMMVLIYNIGNGLAKSRG